MPILNENTLEFFSRSAEQTRRLGTRLGTLMKPGHLICLSGDLGSGKTTLVQGLAKGWGSTDPVTSPTFVLINEYNRPDKAMLYHMDAYRLKNASEGEDLDIEMMLDHGLLVVEWPENIQASLPSEYLLVAMRWMADQQRGLVITAMGQVYQNLLSTIRQQMYGGY